MAASISRKLIITITGGNPVYATREFAVAYARDLTSEQATAIANFLVNERLTNYLALDKTGAGGDRVQSIQYRETIVNEIYKYA